MGQQHRTGRRLAPDHRARGRAADMLSIRPARGAAAPWAGAVPSAGEAEGTASPWPGHGTRIEVRLPLQAQGEIA